MKARIHTAERPRYRWAVVPTGDAPLKQGFRLMKTSAHDEAGYEQGHLAHEVKMGDHSVKRERNRLYT